MAPFRSLGFILILAFAPFLPSLESACRSGCELALGAYYVTPNVNASYIAPLFDIPSFNALGPYNPSVRDLNSILSGNRLHVFFSCDCINGEFLGHNFSYQVVSGDTYTSIASDVYGSLTTVAALAHFNSFPENNVQAGANINVIVNCSCGDKAVSSAYGLFETYPIHPPDNLSSIAAAYNFTSQEALLQNYNPGSNFTSGTVFIPTTDPTGSYRPLSSSAGISGGAIAGIIVALIVALLLGICLYIYHRRRKKTKKALFLSPTEAEASIYSAGATSRVDSSPFAGITVDRSVEFPYEELATATNDFGLTNKIGGGGFGIVYYAELRGEKAAIKKMDMQATNEFLAELKVLTNVHHLNLVRLIGYCTEVSLFLVYEFIENGNLSEHLRGLGSREPLPWLTRVQIALDSARGLEYIHEHTVPVYIHRDIKSPNILINKNFRAKVADFGLAKLTEVGASLQTRLVGTFGYMPPEYAQYGEVSPKVDVYAFGVVLYELISAKDAIVKTDSSATESRGLVALFDETLGKPDPKEELKKLVDPRLGQDYPLDSVLAMAWLAKCCTQENPLQRPSMRQIVVSLMTLSSATEDWDMGTFANQSLVNLMSGR
ncbi:chitin elicitor receptor kinase 1-like isoform X1 [Zingiber officinale]|uniref:chitin elicitor receptor kinase 1-like isoform X1 n=1 Tax=Zingiber officinale TaxID=94328 RepID=UPI001C4B2EFE|nr:chitin elicitor receptor kinase 1-like isoform X1 [Zingiber officinale]